MKTKRKFTRYMKLFWKRQDHLKWVWDTFLGKKKRSADGFLQNNFACLGDPAASFAAKKIWQHMYTYVYIYVYIYVYMYVFYKPT